MISRRHHHSSTKLATFVSELWILVLATSSLFTPQNVSAQSVANTVVFDRGTQVYRQDLDGNDLPIPNSLIPLASVVNPQEAQEPQWSRTASSAFDALGRIVYQRGTPGARGMQRSTRSRMVSGWQVRGLFLFHQSYYVRYLDSRPFAPDRHSKRLPTDKPSGDAQS
jgi:hypothetical protein